MQHSVKGSGTEVQGLKKGPTGTVWKLGSHGIHTTYDMTVVKGKNALYIDVRPLCLQFLISAYLCDAY